MIKKIFESKKNIIILIIAVVVIIEIFILIFSKPKSNVTNTPIPQNQITPTQNQIINQIQNSNITSPPSNPTLTSSKKNIPTETTEEILDLDYRRPLSRLLPYQGKYFKSIRYVGTNKLEILVKDKADTQLAKKEAQDWLVENGVDQDDEIIVSYHYY